MSKQFDIDNEIESFIDKFDFEKVHQVMEFLDWKWLGTPTYDVPSISMMQYSVRHYMRQCADGAIEKLKAKPKKKKAMYGTGTGGFHYRAWAYRDSKKIYFEVIFGLADWNNYD